MRSGVDSDSDASYGVDLFNIVEGSEVVNQVDVYGGSEFKDGLLLLEYVEQYIQKKGMITQGLLRADMVLQ